MRKLLYPFLFLAVACTGHKTPVTENGEEIVISHARGFIATRYPEYTYIQVRNPWDSSQFLQKYILVDRERDLPDPLPEGTVVRIPLEKVVAYASPHCGVLQELDVTETLTGVCESRYIDLPFVKEGVLSGKIPDLGEATAPDVERLIELHPDAVMTSPFQNVGYGRVGKTGIPIIECADYMEHTPLGRAEWLRFHGLFHKKEKLADSLFQVTVRKYEKLKELASGAASRPTLLAERKTGPTWYVPGGASYMAALYNDAGADYLWKENKEAGSLALSFEEVLEKASEADIWLIKYNAAQDLTYDQMAADFRLNTRFASWKNRNIFVCNTAGIPYYEEMPLHPDRLLENLVWVFHPELLPNYTPRYFTPMNH